MTVADDWLRVMSIGGDDYECRMTILKADSSSSAVGVMVNPRTWAKTRWGYSQVVGIRSYKSFVIMYADEL